MTHGSLFSGIGGFDYAAELIGWENVFHCEINPFCRKVLNYHFPKSISHDDITKTDFTIYRGQVDIITGGFPCQPYSLAGKRLGKDDERHLWPEMLRAIREIQPSWIVGENVFGIVNWNGGLVFNEVQVDLETEGYEVQAYVLPACAVNAPHRRDRVWFVAYTNSSRGNKSKLQQSNLFAGSIRDNKQTTANTNNTGNTTLRSGNNRNREKESSKWKHTQPEPCRPCNQGITADTSSSRRGNGLHGGSENGKRQTGELGNPNKEQFTQWQDFPTQSPVCNGNDGLSTELDGITFSKWRNESIKAGGNAIVPQVVLQIFKTIEQYENLLKTNELQ